MPDKKTIDQQAAAKRFAQVWKDRGYEKGDSQTFWLSLLHDVYGVEHPGEFISFEEQVHLDHTSFIDGTIPATRVMIEQKSLGKDLRKAITQSDGSKLTPFQQAKRYITELPVSQHPRWVVTCNFAEFNVYDMERPNGEPEVICLKDLEKEYYRLQFLVDTGNSDVKKEMEISLKAGELVGALYDKILAQYKDPTDPHSLKSLNMLCVRLVFCLYAEDAGIFGGHGKFHNYLKKVADRDVADVRPKLIELFRVLDTKEADRDPYMEDELASFPYVNGGLFADESIEIPRFNEEIVHLLLDNVSENFNWRDISPTIFGAVFESTLNPETRRSGGMHYTSIENIHKVIDPLFLDGLRRELDEIKEIAVDNQRKRKLEAFQKKLASLTFLDSACGSGNFLTETYLSLRKLENEVISLLQYGQITFGDEHYNPIQVSIGQFYGIEINDFAVTVAKTALWIAENQMMQQTESIIHMHIDFLPLKSYANIIEANALRIDWKDVVPPHKLNYIMGNPPFVGHQWRSAAQADDMKIAFYDLPKHGKLDYVAAWYRKAADYMQNTSIHAAFVSTNSIAQGESVGILWKFLFQKKTVEIQFAYRTFIWISEAKSQAAVHCVIIGFTCFHVPESKHLYENGRVQIVDHINGYLLDAPDVFIQSRGKPLTKGLPEMSKGSQPTDGGHLLLSSEERSALITKYPYAVKFIKRFVGSRDLINNEFRYCLWLKGVPPQEYRKIPEIRDRLEAVAECRRKSPTESVRRDADIPMLFTQIRQPENDYLAVPEVSSQNRRYIPISFLNADVIASNKLYLTTNANLYIFGIMVSNVHMSWMRVVGGRLKSDYSYSPAVYNNFPWPTPTDAQKAKIEQTAQGILEARALYPDASLADLYDEVTMPPELRKAHQENDRAVMHAYGMPVKGTTESSCVAELMRRYQELVKKDCQPAVKIK